MRDYAPGTTLAFRGNLRTRGDALRRVAVLLGELLVALFDGAPVGGPGGEVAQAAYLAALVGVLGHSASNASSGAEHLSADLSVGATAREQAQDRQLTMRLCDDPFSAWYFVASLACAGLPDGPR